MPTVTFSLPESLRDFVNAQVKTRGYGNVSEYFRGLLRDAQEQESNKRLERLLLTGLASGPDIAISSEYWAKKRRSILAKVKRKTKKKHPG
jgi:antitoxin ParD1/3/4